MFVAVDSAVVFPVYLPTSPPFPPPLPAVATAIIFAASITLSAAFIAAAATFTAATAAAFRTPLIIDAVGAVAVCFAVPPQWSFGKCFTYFCDFFIG